MKVVPDEVGIDLNAKVGDKALKETIAEASAKGELVLVPSRNALLYARPGKAPESMDYFLLARPLTDDITVDGKLVKKITVVSNGNQGGILITLTDDGKAKFKKFTEDNLKRYIVIKVDDGILHTVRLTETIVDGEMLISGWLTRSDAAAMAAKLQRVMPTP